MHSALFNLKRAYLQSLKVPRSKLKSFNITPARFDLLLALYRNPHHECFRADLVAALGTVKSNVYRLCDAVEKMGLAKADWEAWRIIKLTKEGVALVRKVLAACAELIGDLVDACAEPPAPADDPVERLVNALKKVRAALGDRVLFDVYAENFPQRLFALRVLPRAKKYFG